MSAAKIEGMTITQERRECVPAEGEPSFTLLGRDPVAPHLLFIWAAMRARLEPMSEKVARARDIAVQMVKFKAEHPELGMPIKPEEIIHDLAEEEAKVSGHSARLLVLRNITMQHIVHEMRELLNAAGIGRILISNSLEYRIERVLANVDGFLWFRHLKTQGVYAKVAGEVEVQSSRPIVEGDKLVIYCGEGGRMWARLEEEFNDGRFQEVRPNPATGKFE